MNLRKIFLYSLGGVFAVLAVGALLFPFKNGLAANEEKQSTDRSSQSPPNFDLLASSPARTSDLQNAPRVEGGHITQTEPRFDVPTFLWASDPGTAQTLSSQSLQRTNDEEAAARGHLGSYASRYRLNKSDLLTAKVASIHDTGSGAIIVKFKQNVGGVEVFRDEVNVIMNRNLQLVALSGYLTGEHASDALQNFNTQPVDALAKAIRDLTGSDVDSSLLKPIENDAGGKNIDGNSYQRFTAENNSLNDVTLSDEPSRVKRVMFHLPEGFVPAYYVETSVMVPSDESVSVSGEPVLKELGYSYVISAVDGQLLFRNNLSADQKKSARSNISPSVAYTYRVWADPVTLIPYDSPAGNSVHPKDTATPDGAQYPFVAQANVSLQNFPFSTNDPWLPAGAVDTSGNNVDAFVNLTTPDGYGPIAAAPYDGTSSTGDFRALPTGANAFQHTAVADTNPLTAEVRQADIQQLFYNINFLHDWFYDAGFNEASGNAQTSNFSRGGLENDNIKAQAQDFTARNNANMLTPADGARPRMRMYMFDAIAPKYLDVISPAAAAGRRGIGTGQFGAQVFDMTNQVVQPSPASGCTAASYTGTAGKIVMVDYEPTATCSIGTKLSLAMSAGVSAFVLVYLSTSPDGVVNVTGSLPTFTIPFLSISWNGAAAIKTQLAAAQTVTARIRRDAGSDRDGTIDNQIVAHEWGHYISNRLIGNGNGLNNVTGGGMGEGWGDFTAMLLTVRSNDTAVATNTNWNGTYALATYATSGGPSGDTNQGYYWGIRRLPYSTDMTKDGLTLKHISNGQPLPVGPPTGFGADGTNNAEVHNTGEVWSTMLWECYAALLRDTQGGVPRLTFQQAQDRMKNYVVAGYKMTPLAPTFLEARDAVLAAAFANDPVDGQRFAVAFAKRGAGTGAVVPDRYSSTQIGVVESFTNSGILSFVGATVDDSIRTFDSDGYLDSHERGLLKITVKNVGMTALTSTTATVTSSDPLIGFPNGGTVNFPTLQPQVATTVSLHIQAGNISNLRIPTFNITVTDPGSPLVAPMIAGSLSTYANADELPGVSATDSVEAKQSPFTASSNPSLVKDASAQWQRRAVGSLNYVWFCPDVNGGSDQYLTSPVMTMSSGSFNLQFDHSWGFEFDGGGNYDGGVVEMSVNGGAFTDIGTAAYNGTVLVYSGNVNPLQGRTAFVQNSAGTVHTSLTQAVAPGSTVQFRFRAASDASFGSTGWQIDNIAVTGVGGTPFATLVAELTPTAANVSVEGGVFAGGRAVSRAIVSYTDSNGVVHSATTNSFGHYRFTSVTAGSSYIFNVTAKRYTFATRVVSVADVVENLDFTADE